MNKRSTTIYKVFNLVTRDFHSTLPNCWSHWYNSKPRGYKRTNPDSKPETWSPPTLKDLIFIDKIDSIYKSGIEISKIILFIYLFSIFWQRHALLQISNTTWKQITKTSIWNVVKKSIHGAFEDSAFQNGFCVFTNDSFLSNNQDLGMSFFSYWNLQSKQLFIIIYSENVEIWI